MAGKGVVTRWERIHKNNHWFDALYNACVAGHRAGVRLLPDQTSSRPRIKLAELAARKRQERQQGLGGRGS